MVIAEIVSGRIIPFPSEYAGKSIGSELVFNGRVRDTEEGQVIVALEYEYYEGMAEMEMQNLAAETVEKFSINDLFCCHRVGTIPVGETALHVSIRSEHRSEGLAAMTWFIAEVKQRVPIWKWSVFPDGSKMPTGGKDTKGAKKIRN